MSVCRRGGWKGFEDRAREGGWAVVVLSAGKVPQRLVGRAIWRFERWEVDLLAYIALVSETERSALRVVVGGCCGEISRHRVSARVRDVPYWSRGRPGTSSPRTSTPPASTPVGGEQEHLLFHHLRKI